LSIIKVNIFLLSSFKEFHHGRCWWFTSYGPIVWECKQVWKKRLYVMEIQNWNFTKGKGPLESNDQKPINTNVLNSCTKQENHTLNLIVQSLSNSQLMIVCQNTTSKGVWKVLAKRHLNKGLTSFVFLTCRFFNNQMTSNEIVEQHINKLNVTVEEFNAIGTKMPPKLKVTWSFLWISLIVISYWSHH